MTVNTIFADEIEDLYGLGNLKISPLEHIRKESLDLYNRLHSIAEDVAFVDQVHEAYPSIPILPNLRCGAWSTNPAIANSTPAYFKSTDGHFSNWSFNLRRANLHLLPLVIENRGMILVDSTRAGKRIPDALSKTVPIWCAVINRAMVLLRPILKADSATWNTELYAPPGAVSPQEHHQIEQRLDIWAEALAKSSFTLPTLPLPLRPIWITPATSAFPALPLSHGSKFLPVICVSASRQIQEGTDRRSGGFAYIQGSGDDHELWGMGLTPELFWKHYERLLEAERADLPGIVASLFKETSLLPGKTVIPPTPIQKVGGQILICTLDDLPFTPTSSPSTNCMGYVLLSPTGSSTEDVGIPAISSSVLRLELPEGKKGASHFLTHVLPSSTSFIHSYLAKSYPVCIACASGKDASVGVSLASLGMFFDDDGNFINSGGATATPDKQSLRTRLEWIIASRPEANPSRTTLKKVNEFLLSSLAFNRRA